MRRGSYRFSFVGQDEKALVTSDEAPALESDDGTASSMVLWLASARMEGVAVVVDVAKAKAHDVRELELFIWDGHSGVIDAIQGGGRAIPAT